MNFKRAGALAGIAIIASGGRFQAQSIDPMDLAEQMPEASWNRVMKEFQKLDQNDDGLLSRAEKRIEGEIHDGHSPTYEFPNDLPLKWTASLNLAWEDGTVSRSEFWQLLATVRSLPPRQRAAALRSWLLLRKSIREGGV